MTTDAPSNPLDYRIVSGPPTRPILLRFVDPANKFRSGPGDPLEAFLRFLARYAIDASRQSAAFDGDRLVAYSLCLVGPGAAANVFLPESFPDLPPGFAFSGVAVEVLKHLNDQMAAWDLAIFQAMVKDEDSSQAQIFHRAGYAPICRLTIMEALVETSEDQPDPAGIAWVSFDPDRSETFARLIIRTYESSLDCPALSGLRTGLEVLAGHRYSGLFEPRGWWLLKHGPDDAGLVLLNSTEEDPFRLELVYMGIVPTHRRQGLGRVLLRRAAHVARSLGKKKIRLAVDTRNVPAVQLYRSVGFQPVGEQTVLAVLNESRRGKIQL